MRKGQGAFEYILLIGGVLVIAVVVILIIQGAAASGAAETITEADRVMCGGYEAQAVSNTATITNTLVLRAAVTLKNASLTSAYQPVATFNYVEGSYPVTMSCTNEGICTATLDRQGNLTGVSLTDSGEIRLVACGQGYVAGGWDGVAGYCGDGACGAGETIGNCPEDCQQTGVRCGNGVCDTGENPCNCPSDCTLADFGWMCCSDSECTAPYICYNHQCVAGPPVCGDGFCQLGEDYLTCDLDCCSGGLAVVPDSSPQTTTGTCLSDCGVGSFCAGKSPGNHCLEKLSAIGDSTYNEKFFKVSCCSGTETYLGPKRVHRECTATRCNVEDVEQRNDQKCTSTCTNGVYSACTPAACTWSSLVTIYRCDQYTPPKICCDPPTGEASCVNIGNMCKTLAHCSTSDPCKTVHSCNIPSGHDCGVCSFTSKGPSGSTSDGCDSGCGTSATDWQNNPNAGYYYDIDCTPAKIPDLVLNNYVISSGGIQIKNAGTGSTYKSFKVKIEQCDMGDVDIPQRWEYKCTLNYGALNPGNTQTKYCSAVAGNPSNVRKIRITTDSDSNIIESNEGNNLETSSGVGTCGLGDDQCGGYTPPGQVCCDNVLYDGNCCDMTGHSDCSGAAECWDHTCMAPCEGWYNTNWYDPNTQACCEGFYAQVYNPNTQVCCAEAFGLAYFGECCCTFSSECSDYCCTTGYACLTTCQGAGTQANRKECKPNIFP